LHELWTWAIQDPIGAFYGREIHDRLATAYPDYAAWIEPYRIVDRHGNVFYPTSETRTFLLQRALDREAPPVMIAETTTAPETPAAATPRTSVEERRTVTPSTTGTRRRIASSAPVTVKTPVQTTVEPVVPAIVETAPAPVTTASVPPPVTLAPPKSAVPAQAAPAPARSPVNGILLLVIGILGVLLLAVILRTQRTAKVMS
ncbi:MAG TPA: hypothetical protein VFO89_00395, partial [Thermoanaerobaculia bacterium]|nr:hypothetical protein [Thermoanaerobaculia bacterium]